MLRRALPQPSHLRNPLHLRLRGARRASRKASMTSALPDKFQLAGKTVVVTGASRGIGLEFVKQLLEKGNKVVATARNPAGSAGLTKLQEAHAGSLILTSLDVDNVQSIQEWSVDLAGKVKTVDVLINNAGILQSRAGLMDVTPEAMMAHYVTNCMGPIFTVQQLLRQNLLQQGALIATLTSLVASVTENSGGALYAYRCSKSAANMAVKSMSIDLAPRGITSTILHPGYVRTDMTAGQGLIDVDESVRGMLDVLESGRPLNGEWYHTTGRHLPW